MEELIGQIGWAEITTAVLVILSAILGTKYNNVKKQAKEWMEKGKDLAIKSYNVPDTVIKAIEDNKVTPKEIEKIKKAINNWWSFWK